MSTAAGLAAYVHGKSGGVRLADKGAPHLGLVESSTPYGGSMAEIRIEPRRRNAVWAWTALATVVAAGVAYYFFVTGP